MREHIIDCGNGFWNIRGRFRLAGLLDVGTHASLLRRADGGFTLIDSYALTGALLEEVNKITGGPRAITRVINTHPFHTVHAEAMHAQLPHAAHYGTARHKTKFPDLTWAELTTEDPAFWATQAPDLEFSVPGGVELIPANQHIHCGTVLAYHPKSGALHVDDTFNHGILGMGKKKQSVSVHPTLGKALESRAGAAQDFRDWGKDMLARWPDIKALCTAHDGVLFQADLGDGRTINGALKRALERSEKTLAKHEAKYAS